jgi:hypothetical protein
MPTPVRKSSWIRCAFTAAALFAASLVIPLGAQATHPAVPARPAAAAPANPQDTVNTQDQLLKLLRLSPTLTSVVARDPSLLADQAYVSRNNPELAQFLAAHPEVVRNPDFFLFTKLGNGGPDRARALEKVVWPELVQTPQRESSVASVAGVLVPIVVVPAFFAALVLIFWLIFTSRRTSRFYKMQSEVHAKLIDKFSTSQDLAAYMQTEAGQRFLEGLQMPQGRDAEARMPNAVARVFTPLEVGIVLFLLGVGCLLLRYASPEMGIPMLVLGTLVLLPGIGFILSAGATWMLARRLGLMPESAPKEADSSLHDRL